MENSGEITYEKQTLSLRDRQHDDDDDEYIKKFQLALRARINCLMRYIILFVKLNIKLKSA